MALASVESIQIAPYPQPEVDHTSLSAGIRNVMGLLQGPQDIWTGQGWVEAVGLDAHQFADQVTQHVHSYPPDVVRYMNNVGDLPTMHAALGDERTPLAILLHGTLPGVPALWYGDELWVGDMEECTEDHPISHTVIELERLRNENAAMASANIEFIRTDSSVVDYVRTSEDESRPDDVIRVVANVNQNGEDRQVVIEDDMVVQLAVGEMSQRITRDGQVVVLRPNASVVFSNAA